MKPESGIPCKFCEQRHDWYSVPTLAQQFDVDAETIRRRLYKVDHLKLGRKTSIPECQVHRLFDETITVSSAA